jgi:tetratricopeptide (TPR) repeat protein
MFRLCPLLLLPFCLFAQPEFAALTRAYDALRIKSYDAAVAAFQEAIAAAPARPDIRKDLAYAYLKIGENDAAREQFGKAMELDPKDESVALEFAFLSFEAKDDQVPNKALARRIFDRFRHTGNATAERAFQNIDAPLKQGIERWTQALQIGPESFSAHYELAQLAEQRDDLALAEDHYLKAWRMLPARKSVLLDLGRVRKQHNHTEEGNAALLAASRGGEPRAADKARELLPSRYPYVYEFRKALDLDPGNTVLHRELAYLLLKMGENAAAEVEFEALTKSAPDDLLAAAQLGFLYLGRKERVRAMPLFQRVLDGNDRELSAKVRSAIEPHLMAEKSLKAGYFKDALRYLNIAHESDPGDPDVMLKLGWTYNMLHDDKTALDWFKQARRSDDDKIASEANRAYEALKPGVERVRTTVWALPFYSTRWKDAFAYGQIKTEFRVDRLPFTPYLSIRMIADARPSVPVSQALSERSFIFGVGVRRTWRRFTGWAEAGNAVNEAGNAVNYVTHSMLPDYRGGLNWARGWKTESNLFLETTADEVYVSRFNKDWLTSLQSRAGYKWLLINANLTADAQHQYWANFVEAGPGVRFHVPSAPRGMVFSVSFLRGVYLINEGNPRRPNFNDVRAGFWYALTK